MFIIFSFIVSFSNPGMAQNLSPSLTNLFNNLHTTTNAMTQRSLRQTPNIENRVNSYGRQLLRAQFQYGRQLELANAKLKEMSRLRRTARTDQHRADIIRHLESANKLRTQANKMRAKLKSNLKVIQPASTGRVMIQKVASWPKFKDKLDSKSKNPAFRKLVKIYNSEVLRRRTDARPNKTQPISKFMIPVITKAVKNIRIGLLNPTSKGPKPFK